MNTDLFDIKGKKKKKISLPVQFTEEYRPDLIKRAYIANKSLNYQAYGTDPLAGLRKSSTLSKKRRKYRGGYGHGWSRTPKKVMSRKGMRFNFVGAFAPHAKGGRTAHPPRTEKVIVKKINKKESKKALRSAISATDKIIVEEKMDGFKKIKDVQALMKALKLNININKKVRSGKGKMRGRKYKTGKGILFVTVKNASLMNACRNLEGTEVINVKNLNVTMLAPGGKAGRKTIWSMSAIKKMNEEGLFT